MKNSSYGHYGSTAAAPTFDDVGAFDRYGPHRSSGSSSTTMMSRGMQLEAAVEKLPGWYFGIDDTNDDTNTTNNNGENECWRSSSSTSTSTTATNSGSSTRARRNQLFYLDDDDLLGSVAELALSTDDDEVDCDAENNAPRSCSSSASTTAAPLASQSIRSRYLFDSPVATSPVAMSSKPAAVPMGNSTTEPDTVPSPEHRKPSDASTSVSSASIPAATRTTSTRATSSSSPPTNRQHRLSSRRSTLSSTCAATDLVVTRFTISGRDKKVMYHIDVVNHESQLQTYTIRRSYTDFKALHSDLSAVLDARKEYYLSRAQLRQSVLDAPNKERRSLPAVGAASSNSFHRSQQLQPTPEDAVEAAVMAFSLPTLPHAGLLSFWRRHDHAHLQHRCAAFQSLLRAIVAMPFLRESFAMQKFLSTAPCAIRERGSSYVSLCEYSVPHIDLDEEHRERRRRAQEHRRNSSATSASMGMYEY